MVNGNFFPKFVKVVERAKVACNRTRNTPCCCSLPPRKLFNAESGSVNEACTQEENVYRGIVLAH